MKSGEQSIDVIFNLYVFNFPPIHNILAVNPKSSIVTILSLRLMKIFLSEPSLMKVFMQKLLNIPNTQYFIVLQPLTFYLETKIKNISSTFH